MSTKPPADTVAAENPHGFWRGVRKHLRLPGGQNRILWILAATMALGAALRLVGLSWGLPLTLHADEWVVVKGAIDMASRNSFEPGYFFRPDHLEMQLSYLAFQGYSHIIHGMSPEVLFAQSPSTFYLISRTITALFGIAMIPLAYLIGSRFSRPVGILSAIAVTLFPPFITNSHFATPDIPLACACMVVILGCMIYLDSGSWRALAIASFGVAMAITIKYPGAVATLMIAVVILIQSIKARSWLRLISHGLGSILMVAGFLFTLSPVLFTNVSAVLEQVRGQNSTGHLGADGLDWSGNLAFYAHDFATGAGVIAVLLFGLGVFWSVRLRLTQAVPLLLGIIMWIALSRLELHWYRWGLPMYLTPLLFAPIGIYFTALWIKDQPRKRALAAGITFALALTLTTSGLAAASVAATATFLATDTRTAALRYTQSHEITPDNAIYEGYTPLSPGLARLFFADFEIDGETIRVAEGSTPQAPDYVVTSSGMSARFMNEPKYVEEQKVYRLLDEQFPVVERWHATTQDVATSIELLSTLRSIRYVASLAAGGLAGPEITIYRVPSGHR